MLATMRGRHRSRHRPTNDLAREQVHRGSHEQPAFVRADVGDVGEPNEAGSPDLEAPLQQVASAVAPASRHAETAGRHPQGSRHQGDVEHRAMLEDERKPRSFALAKNATAMRFIILPEPCDSELGIDFYGARSGGILIPAASNAIRHTVGLN